MKIAFFFRIFYGIFHNNRKNIHNFLKYFVSNELCQVLLKSKYFGNSYEAFLLFNLANVFLCFGTTMCHFILEKNLLPPNWLVKQKNSLLERSKELKKTYDKNYILRWSSSQNMPGLKKIYLWTHLIFAHLNTLIFLFKQVQSRVYSHHIE